MSLYLSLVYHCHATNSACKMGQGSVYSTNVSIQDMNRNLTELMGSTGRWPYAPSQPSVPVLGLRCWSALDHRTLSWSVGDGKTFRPGAALLFLAQYVHVCCMDLWPVGKDNLYLVQNTSVSKASVSCLLLSPFTLARLLDSLLLLFTSLFHVRRRLLGQVEDHSDIWPYEGWRWWWRTGL